MHVESLAAVMQSTSLVQRAHTKPAALVYSSEAVTLSTNFEADNHTIVPNQGLLATSQILLVCLQLCSLSNAAHQQSC